MGFFYKSLQDKVPRSVFRVSTQNSPGAGGGYIVRATVMVINGTKTVMYVATQGFEVFWTRAVGIVGGGGVSGVNSPVEIISSTGVAAVNSAKRTIVSVAFDLVEVDEYRVDFQVTAEHAGSYSAQLQCACWAELTKCLFDTTPTLEWVS
jgi:hypothetical protein